jgi:transposase
MHPSQLNDWVKKFADDPQHVFPTHGQMKPKQPEIARLKREVAKLKAERDIGDAATGPQTRSQCARSYLRSHKSSPASGC